MGSACPPEGLNCSTQQDLSTIPEPTSSASSPSSSPTSSFISDDWQSSSHTFQTYETVTVTSENKTKPHIYEKKLKTIRVKQPSDFCPIVCIPIKQCIAQNKHSYPCRRKACSDKVTTITVLLDSGSNVNLITVGLAKQLKLKMHGPFKSSISTANGVHTALTYRCTINFLTNIQLMCFTHQDLGSCPGSEFPIIPRFEEVDLATKHLHNLNGTYPRKSSKLDLIVSMSNLPRLLVNFSSPIYYSISKNPLNIKDLKELEDDNACISLYRTWWGEVWAGRLNRTQNFKSLIDKGLPVGSLGDYQISADSSVLPTLPVKVTRLSAIEFANLSANKNEKKLDQPVKDDSHGATVLDEQLPLQKIESKDTETIVDAEASRVKTADAKAIKNLKDIENFVDAKASQVKTADAETIREIKDIENLADAEASQVKTADAEAKPQLQPVEDNISPVIPTFSRNEELISCSKSTLSLSSHQNVHGNSCNQANVIATSDEHDPSSPNISKDTDLTIEEIDAIFSCNKAIYSTDDLVVLFKRMCDLDRLPMDVGEKIMTSEESQAVKLLNQVMVLDPDKKRISTKLLLKKEVNLENNYYGVKSRNDQMHRAFHRDPIKTKARRDMYHKKFQEFQTLGVLHEVQDDTPELSSPGRKYYLPMSVVEKLTSISSPYRLVVEGNHKSPSGLSLNDNILDTPSLHQKILDIELRSRLKPVLLVCDIRKLFLQLQVPDPSDQDLMRVLYKGPDSKLEDPYRIFRFSCQIWGLKDSPFQLNSALHKCVTYWLQAEPRSDLEKEIAEEFTRNLYVDDLTMSFESEEIAIQAIRIVNDIIGVGGFVFRKFLSNRHNVLASVPEEHRAPFTSIQEVEKGQEMEKYVSHPALQLGYSYLPCEDCYILDRFDNVEATRDCTTKRGCLSAMASLFDVLGFLGPFKLIAKLVLKETFKYGIDWNSPLSSMLDHPEVCKNDKTSHLTAMLNQWQAWLQDLKKLRLLKFPRFLYNNSESIYMIASDASKSGLCAVCHVITKHGNGQITSHLLSSQCNVTPLKVNFDKELSIPLLELKAISFSVDIGKWLISEGDVKRHQLMFISDSRVAIAWTLKDPQKLLSHIGTVVTRVQDESFKINYVNTHQNSAADLGSRGGLFESIDSDVWRHGPSWYCNDRQNFPFMSHETTEEKYRLQISSGLKKKFSILESERIKIKTKNQEKQAQSTKLLTQLAAQHSSSVIPNGTFASRKINLFKKEASISLSFIQHRFPRVATPLFSIIATSECVPTRMHALLHSREFLKSQARPAHSEHAIQGHSSLHMIKPNHPGQWEREVKKGAQEFLYSCDSTQFSKLKSAISSQSHTLQDSSKIGSPSKPNPLDQQKVKYVLPIMQYLGVTSWGFRRLIRIGAAFYNAIDCFKNLLLHKEGKVKNKFLTTQQSLKNAPSRRDFINSNYIQPTDAHKHEAKMYYISQLQQTFYSEEIETLKAKHRLARNDPTIVPAVKLSSPIATLHPFLMDSGTTSGPILHVTGRIENEGQTQVPIVHISTERKYPILLHKKSKFAVLLVMEIHHSTYEHASFLHIYNQLRREYYIPQGRQMCRKVVSMCLRCKRQNTRHLKQFLGNLPVAHFGAQNIRPFLHVALDYTGYISLKPVGAGNKRHFKGYIAIFYCLFSKAFHCEIVSANDTLGFLSAYQRLCCYRGQPQFLYSDNQPAFIKGEKMIRERLTALNQQIQDEQEHHTFQWTYGSAYSPNSLWEKPIHMVKRGLGYYVTKKTYTYEQLNTILQRVVFTLNERPLFSHLQTASGKSPQSFHYISPNRLLYSYDLSTLPLEYSKTEVPLNTQGQRDYLLESDMCTQHLANFYQENYITEAQNRHFWNRPEINLEVGDLVMIKPHGSRQHEKRSSWDLARVLEIHRSPRDDLVRRATVFLQTMKEDTLPINMIYPMVDAKYRREAEQLKSTRKILLEEINCFIQSIHHALHPVTNPALCNDVNSR